MTIYDSQFGKVFDIRSISKFVYGIRQDATDLMDFAALFPEHFDAEGPCPNGPTGLCGVGYADVPYIKDADNIVICPLCGVVIKRRFSVHFIAYVTVIEEIEAVDEDDAWVKVKAKYEDGDIETDDGEWGEAELDHVSETW